MWSAESDELYATSYSVAKKCQVGNLDILNVSIKDAHEEKRLCSGDARAPQVLIIVDLVGEKQGPHKLVIDRSGTPMCAE